MLRKGLAGIAALQLPGLLAMNVGCDLGLLDGGWTFAITNDWQDADAYRVYDAEEEHNRLPREICTVLQGAAEAVDSTVRVCATRSGTRLARVITATSNPAPLKAALAGSNSSTHLHVSR
jgi:hypothetical protein